MTRGTRGYSWGVAEYQITYWRDIPSMVTARDGDDVVKVQLAARFQEAIDEAAMRAGDTDADAYLAGWLRSDWLQGDGTATELAERVGRELEENLNDERLNQLVNGE